MLVDLVKPSVGSIGSESLLVTLSRAQDLNQIGLMRPLYHEDREYEKKAYVNDMRKVIKLSPEKLKELQRYEEAGARLRNDNKDLLQMAQDIGHANLPNTYTCMNLKEYMQLIGKDSKKRKRHVRTSRTKTKPVCKD